MLLRPFEKLRRLTLDQYRNAFYIRGLTRPPGARRATLVHPIMPSVSRVGLWYAIPRGCDAPEKVELRLELNGQHYPANTTHQPMHGVGRIIAHGLPHDKLFAATLVLDDMEHGPFPVCTAPMATPAFSLLAYSCFSPFPKRWGKAFKARTVHSLNLLKTRSSKASVGGKPRPAFALAMGDQVYVDADVIPAFPPKRALLFGFKSQHRRYPVDVVERFFEALYDAYMRLRPYQRSLRSLPHVMMWDDHDIRDGWGSHFDEASDSWKAHLNAARRAFISRQYLRNPNPVAFPNFDSLDGQPWQELVQRMVAEKAGATRRPELHFQFEWGSAARFFVMDLRSRREAKSKTVMSDHQLASIEKWLSSGGGQGKPPTLYVLVSSLPLTYEPEGSSSWTTWRVWFRADDRRDSWWSDESRGQRDQLLALLQAHFRANEADRLLVLSGDVHFAEILSLSLATPTGNRVFGHEVISSGLAQASFRVSGRNRLGDPQQPIPGFFSESAGSRLFAPHFAEIFVGEGSPSQAPSVEVLFYPAAATADTALVNPLSKLDELVSSSGADEKGPLPLAVGDGAEPATLKSFERFMLPWPNAPRGNQNARTWRSDGK